MCRWWCDCFRRQTRFFLWNERLLWKERITLVYFRRPHKIYEFWIFECTSAGNFRNVQLWWNLFFLSLSLSNIEIMPSFKRAFRIDSGFGIEHTVLYATITSTTYLRQYYRSRAAFSDHHNLLILEKGNAQKIPTRTIVILFVWFVISTISLH